MLTDSQSTNNSATSHWRAYNRNYIWQFTFKHTGKDQMQQITIWLGDDISYMSHV
jgi:hypothetical protein